MLAAVGKRSQRGSGGEGWSYCVEVKSVESFAVDLRMPRVCLYSK